MTTFQLLQLLGITTFISCVVSRIANRLLDSFGKKRREERQDIQALKLGIQALLRAQMINDWNKWSAKEYAPIYARENFENVWQQYHSLGANGVMDDIHEKFLELPTQPNK